MLFSNLTLYRFPLAFGGLAPASFEDAITDLDDRLAEHAARPVGPMELSARGWVPPLGRHTEALSHRVDGCIWIALGGEDKVLPNAVVNEFLARKVDDLIEHEGRRPSSRHRRQLKDDILQDLLHRAFARPYRLDAYLDLQAGFIAINTSSQTQAEALTSFLRETLGTFPCGRLTSRSAESAVLTSWVTQDALPDALTLGDECELRDPSDHGAVVKCRGVDPDDEQVRTHLDAGYQVTRLGLQHQEHVSFVLGEDLVLRRLRFLDGALDSLDDTRRETDQDEADARFALMVGEVRRLFALMDREFSLWAPDAEHSAPPDPVPRSVRRAAQQLQRLAKGDGTRVEITNEHGQGVRIDKDGISRIGGAA